MDATVARFTPMDVVVLGELHNVQGFRWQRSCYSHSISRRNLENGVAGAAPEYCAKLRHSFLSLLTLSCTATGQNPVTVLAQPATQKLDLPTCAIGLE